MGKGEVLKSADGGEHTTNGGPILWEKLTLLDTMNLKLFLQVIH